MLYVWKVVEYKPKGLGYRAVLIELEDGMGKYFKFVLCWKITGSDEVRVIYLEEKEEERGKVLERYFPQSGGLGKSFPKMDDSRWGLATPYIVAAIRRPHLSGRICTTPVRSQKKRGPHLWMAHRTWRQSGGGRKY